MMRKMCDMSVQPQKHRTSEEPKIQALREAAAGFEAIDRGKFQEVLAHEIGSAIRAIGKRARQRLRGTAR
jgi:hypothetical protein